MFNGFQIFMLNRIWQTFCWNDYDLNCADLLPTVYTWNRTCPAATLIMCFIYAKTFKSTCVSPYYAVQISVLIYIL